jgi:hypothetical protein
MSDLTAWFEPFCYGLLAGYFWHPVLALVNKIIEEAKYARDNWRPK